MRCPSCGEKNENKVIDSRLTEGGAVVRRRRMCQTCSRRFTTKERLEEEVRLTIVKQSGSRVPYERDKIFRGIHLACNKLPVTEEQMEEIVGRVEEDLFRNHDRVAATEDIGRYVGRYLRQLNQVAYVRFMSVHRKFGTIEEFVDEIRDVRDRVAAEAPDQTMLFEG